MNTPNENPPELIKLTDLQVNDLIKIHGRTLKGHKSYVFIVTQSGENPSIRCIEPVTSRIYNRSVPLVNNLSLGGSLEIDFPNMLSYKTLINQIEGLQLNQSTISERLVSNPLFSGIRKIVSDIRSSFLDNQ